MKDNIYNLIKRNFQVETLD